MKVISFLGTGGKSETNYIYGEKSCKTDFFPLAVHQFVNCTKHIFVATQKSRTFWEERIKCESKVPYLFADIPNGTTDDELWQIFAALTEVLEPNDKVIFDITHSFRTLPFLALLAMAFLRVSKNVSIEKVLYGTYDPENPTNSDVLDLSPFVRLMEWTTAADQFVKSGDGRELAAILRRTQNSFHLDCEAHAQLPRKLTSLANDLESVSLAMDLARPLETLTASERLEKSLTAAAADIKDYAIPFEQLLDFTREKYQPISLKKPEADWPLTLSKQLAILRLYLERGQILPAATLMREWIVSALCWQFGLPVQISENREKAEATINALTTPNPSWEPPCKEEFLELDCAPQIQNLWSQLREVRNTLAHCGMDQRNQGARGIRDKVNSFEAPLRGIAQSLGVVLP